MASPIATNTEASKLSKASSMLSSTMYPHNTIAAKRWLNRLKVGEKIALGYTISLGVAIAGTAAGVTIGNHIQRQALEHQTHAMAEIELFSQLQAGVLQSRTHQQQLIPLSEFPEDFAEEYSHILAHAESIRQVWAAIEAHAEALDYEKHGTDTSKFLDTYRGVNVRYLEELSRLVAQIDPASLQTPAEVEQAQAQLLTFTNSDLAISFDGISDDLSTLIKESWSEYDKTKSEVALAKTLRDQFTLWGMLGSSAIAALLALSISRAINRPLKSVEETAVKVVQTEDFDLRASVTTDDEVGSLTIALNQLIEWVGHRTQALENARDTLDCKVQERTQELNAIIDNLGNGLLVVDRERRIIRANPTLKSIFNLERDDLKNRFVQDFFDERIINLIEQNQTHPTASFSAELPLPGDRIGQATVSAILGESQGDLTKLAAQTAASGTVVLIRDITTEKAVDRMKTDFISTVSHELRTPLTSVLGFAKIIRKKLENVLLPAIVSEDKKTQRAARQVKENLRIILSEGERLTSLINDVLDIAKIEAGKLEWRMAEADPQAVVEQAIAATSIIAKKNNIQIITDIAPNLSTITVDPDRIIQVIINLISNAIKFTKAGGTVTCDVKESEHELYISVIDTGIGISEDDQPKVFEKFKQVGEVMTDKPQGTGLGLPICKQIVEHHGGRIWVESQIDEGSKFSVALPLNASVPVLQTHNPTIEELVQHIKLNVAKVSPAGTTDSDNSTKTILVIDDESNIRRLLRQELETEGYLVKEAKDGVAALASIKQTQPDLIITDIMMPGLDGFDLTAVLKNNPGTASIPTIILSIVEDKNRGFRLGVDRYLTKPIDVASLLSSVGSLLAHKASRNKVLVVNQNTADSKTLIEALSNKGYVVAQAGTAQAGIDKARSIKPDMLIMDAALLEEHDLVKTLRYEQGLENISVILVGDRTPPPQ